MSVRAAREASVARRRRAAAWIAVACLVVSAACGPPPVEGDTRYAGTWVRGNEFWTSRIDLEPDGAGAYRFRLEFTTDNHQRRVSCDDEGRCEEWMFGEHTKNYAFRTWLHPDTGNLMVEYEVTSAKPGYDPSHVLEEVVLEDGGDTLRFFTVERDDRRYEGGERPERVFHRQGTGGEPAVTPGP